MKADFKLFGGKKAGWGQVPKPMQIFIIRGLCTLIAWKALYIFVLKPLHQPDGVLTYATASATTWLFGFVSPQMHPVLLPQNDMLITAVVNGVRVRTIMIADACNALELMVLQAGFIFCIPAPLRKQLKYVVIGWLIIAAANILRCLALIYIYMWYPDVYLFAHHYVFTLIIYFIIFLTWRAFMKQYELYAKKQPA